MIYSSWVCFLLMANPVVFSSVPMVTNSTIGRSKHQLQSLDKGHESEACEDGFAEIGDYCFMWKHDTCREQSLSAAYCAELNSTLSYPTGNIESWQMDISNFVGGQNYWPGATRQSNGSWHWSDGTLVQDEAWKGGVPDDGGYWHCTDMISDGQFNTAPCDYCVWTLCQACDVDALTMDVTVAQRQNIIEVVPMCVHGDHFDITLDNHEVDIFPGVTQIENVTSGDHEVCIRTYNYNGLMLKTLCFMVYVCPDGFEQVGEYCFFWDIYDPAPNKSTSAASCAELNSMLPYPTTDLQYWQSAISHITRMDIIDGIWAGAINQSDGIWLWPDGTQVQEEAWGHGGQYGHGNCSIMTYPDYDAHLEAKKCDSHYYYGTLCQVLVDHEITTPTVPLESTTPAVSFESTTPSLTSAPPTTYTSEHPTTYTPEPSTTYTPEPSTTYTPEPSTTYTPEPSTTYTPEPSTTYTPESSTTYTPEPQINCPDGFNQFGEYCFLSDDINMDQITSEAYCSELSSTLPYPTGDLINWKLAVISTSLEGGLWSGARKQDGGTWFWPDGKEVQSDAWETKPSDEEFYCSYITPQSGYLYVSNCEDTMLTLCQVVPAPQAPLLTILSTTSASIHISWTEDSDDISKYVVTWTSATGENRYETVDHNVTELVIKELLCNTVYDVVVAAYTDINSYANSLVEKVKTNDEVPGEPILQQIVPDDSSPTQLEVSWSKAEYNCSGGLSYYCITWETYDYSWIHNTEDGMATIYTIQHLLPDTEYTVTIAAVSSTGIIGFKDKQTVNTTDIAKEKRCPEITPFQNKYPNYKWDETECKFVTKSCPKMLGSASWVCGCDGHWVNLPDLSDCHNLDLSGWNDIFNSSDDSAGDSLGKLASNITSDEISTGDIQDLVEILDASSARHSADMNNASIDDQFTLSLGFLNGILNISDVIFNSTEVWHGFPETQLKDQATNLQQIIANASISMADVLPLDGDIEFQNFSKIGVKVKKQNSSLYDEDKVNNTFVHQFFEGTWIILPWHLEDDPSIDMVAISVLSYQNLHCILNTVPQCDIIPDETKYPISVVSSPIMGVTVNGEKWRSPDNESQIIFAFDNTYIQKGYTGANITCVFWNNIKENWDTEGCELLTANDADQPMCSCDHLTNLAVIMDVTGKLSEKYDDSLTLMTRICCPISIICLLLSVIVLTKIINGGKNTLKTARATDVMHLNLCCCLLVALITLMSGLDATTNIAGCAIVAFVLHFFFLASFCWMGLEAVNIYHFFILRNETVLTRIRYQHVAAYGFSGLVVIITLISTGGVGYGTEHYCWLDTDRGVIWALVAPAFLILLFNTMIVVWALMIITAEAEKDGHTNGRSVIRVRVRLTKEERIEAKTNVRRLVMLTVMLGPTWLLGFLSSYLGSLFLMGLFTIINSLQGAMIFVLLVLIQKTRRDILLNDVLHLDKIKEFIMNRTSTPKLLVFRRRNSKDLVTLDITSENNENTGTLDTSLSTMPNTSSQNHGDLLF